MLYGLKENIILQINQVFSHYPAVEKVLIYGSRAKGNYRNGSDIDLTLQGNNLSLFILNKISLELDDLLLPYTFDLSLYHHIQNPDLLEHIEDVGKIFYTSSLIS